MRLGEGGRGIVGLPLSENEKVVGFLVFSVYWILVSWSESFKVSKVYQISISCFLEDIDFTSKFFKILADGSSSLFGALLFENCQYFGFPKSGALQNNIV